MEDGVITPEEAMAGYKAMTGEDYADLDANVKAEVAESWNAIYTNNDGNL